MTTQLEQAARLALELIEPIAHNSTDDPRGKAYEAITALRAALEQPAQDVDWEKLYRLEVKKKEALATKYERDTGKKLTYVVPMQQPAQDEPVALETVYETIIQWDEGGGKRSRRELARRIVALYTRPQAREPLDAGEISRLWKQHTNEDGPHFLPYEDDGLGFARAIEAAHGIGEKK